MPINLLCWTDIPVTDLDRAIAFYSAVLGEAVTKQTHENFDMGVLPHSGNNPSGCLSPSDENKPSTTGPLIYLSVEGHLDQSIKTAEISGGKILQPKEQIGPWGYRALILDSEGNRIALHSMVS